VFQKARAFQKKIEDGSDYRVQGVVERQQDFGASFSIAIVQFDRLADCQRVARINI
jgi:hypothetical protein